MEESQKKEKVTTDMGRWASGEGRDHSRTDGLIEETAWCRGSALATPFLTRRVGKGKDE